MATAINTAALMLHYQRLWDSMIIRPEWESKVIDTAHRLKNSQPTYELFVQQFNAALPWYVVAIIHSMEASGDFTCHLHNGDSLKHRTVHEPKGRPKADPKAGIGKPYQWHESANDALAMKDWNNYHTWDIPHILFRMEVYNGMGYQHKGLNSPYLFSSTNHYDKGKFTSDGHYDHNAVSKQVGAAALLKYLL